MVLRLQDILRRVYSPYWSVFPRNGKTIHEDSHVPDRLTLKKSCCREIKSRFGNFEAPLELLTPDQAKDLPGLSNRTLSNLDTEACQQIKAARAHMQWVFVDREPYVVEVWREIMAPLKPVRSRSPHQEIPKDEFPLQFEQIQDDRLPLMSYIAVGRPNAGFSGGDASSGGTLPGVRQITTGDWMRLAFVDNEGNSNTYPYSPTFYHEDPLQYYAYDRFWHPTGDARGQSDHTTRWLCSGYSFAAVGDAASGFFVDPHAGGLAHFRHHYFALTMIALFHRASLLRFKHALAEDADALLNDADSEDERKEKFRGKSERLAEELMRFRAMYWFTEVSNQLQGQEIFAMLRRHLNLDALFRDVCGDAENAATILRQMADDKKKETSLTIAKLGVIFVIASLVLMVLQRPLQASPKSSALFTFLALFGILLAMARATMFELLEKLCEGFGLTYISPALGKRIRSLRQKASTTIWSWVALVSFLVGFAGLAYIVYWWPGPEPERVIRPATVEHPEEKVDAGNRHSIEPQEMNRPNDPVVDSPDAANRQTPPLSDDSSDSSSASGSNSSSDGTAPQNPNSGSAPPNQDDGGDGEASASR